MGGVDGEDDLDPSQCIVSTDSGSDPGQKQEPVHLWQTQKQSWKSILKTCKQPRPDIDSENNRETKTFNKNDDKEAKKKENDNHDNNN